MKKNILIFLFSLIIIFLCGQEAYSQSQEVRNKVIGRWIFSSALASNQGQQELLTEIYEELKSTLSYQDYKADGTFEYKISMMGITNMHKGTWELDNTGKILITKHNDGQIVNLKLIELKPNKMVTEAPTGGQSTFKRQN